MDIKAYRRPEQMSPEGQAITQALAEYLQQITPNPFIRGQLIQRLDLSTTPTRVAHKLNTIPKGWIITRIDADQTVYEASTTTPFDSRFIQLVASGDCTVDIWVF